MNDLPNLPGIRRSPSRIVMKAREELRRAETRQSFEDGTFASNEDDGSLASYFENTSKIHEMSRSLSSFPSTAGSFNDISGRYSLRSQQQDRLNKTMSLPFSTLDNAPAFVVNTSERACKFLAYFTETIPENLNEGSRARKVEISFYLEDNTIEIVEPRERNSGLVQGKVLKRHQIAKSRSNPSEIYSLYDFYAGAVLSIYERDYTVIDCDSWTKRYLEELGVTFGEPLPLPSNYFDPKSRGSGRNSRSSTAEVDPTELHNSKKITGFHQYGRQVLRFYGVWDSQGDLFGDEIQVRLHYILADDTIEILPTFARNCGRDKVPMLLKRTKVMKMASIGEEDSMFSRPSTTTLTEGSFNGTNVPSPEKKVPLRPYHWSDLHIGDLIPVAAMNVLLIDADGFTREFYAKKQMPLGDPIVLPKKEYQKQEVTIPPHTGFGSEIDSLTSCKGSLIPMPPHKDGAKQKMYQGMVLRYLATLESNKAADQSRTFIVMIHLEDDTDRKSVV